ncbi:major facilitator superfamily domain-containing protein [Naematelia encephala]|uniref:Major facilitator superfamily domain-containing protein n=1 Tax=Naematelia encephala TaxID=71784 RepID=A0A1Y2AMN0_9TREE|nr:major facilitator superfamily domain-containing protein [Naematelia encephala]
MAEQAPTSVDTEATPLLGKQVQKKATPLPKLQLAIICLIRIVEPICFQVIFPFINEMLVKIGAAKDRDSVGYPAGIIESIFSLTQLVTVFFWGSLSDRIGRKPVLIIGCVGSSVSAVAFGLSKSFPMLVLTRCLNGVMNGNIGVLKAIMAEICDETNEAKAFSFFPLCLNIGVLIASFIGGTFSSSERFPALHRIPLFAAYPYLLPNLLAAILPLVAAILAAIYLKETLPPPIHHNKSQPPSSPASSTTLDADAQVDEVEDSTSLWNLFTPEINALMFSFAVLSLLGGAVMAILPLFCFTPIADGGLDFSDGEIGTAMAVRAVATIIVQLSAFPWLQRRLGSLRLYRGLMVLWIPAYIGLPMLNGFARLGQKRVVWTGMVMTLLCGAIANMAFVCNLIMTNAAAPNRHMLGAINGYAQVLSSGVRIIGPGGASILFALSINHHILGGYFVWLVFGLVGVNTYLISVEYM